MNLTWKRNSTPNELHSLLQTLSEEYPITEDGRGKEIFFRHSPESNKLTVRNCADRCEIKYGMVNCAARGIGMALAETDTDEELIFKTVGVMVDCSRGAVMKIEHLKYWLRRLSLMGYNMFWLYAEDIYQLPGEPYFGYLRGAYTLEEMQDIDSYAQKLGIEMVACIQTLGHMEQVIKWPCYRGISDTARVLMADEEKTYALIDKMIEFWSRAFSSRRIHIGMDEAHDMARGAFMDRNGYEYGFDVFNRHLEKTKKICSAHNLKPIIWSDMYFRLGSKTSDYYDLESVISDNVKAKIPKDVQLVYWDYHHNDSSFYSEWIKRHRELGNIPIMAAGVSCGVRLWYEHHFTRTATAACLEACRREKVQEIIYTMWANDGAAVEYDSILAGLAWAADATYGNKPDEIRMETMFMAICQSSFNAHIIASGMDVPFYSETNPKGTLAFASLMLWDDPLLGIYWRELQHHAPQCWDQIYMKMISIRENLSTYRNDSACGNLEHAWNCADLLSKKIAFRIALLEAYKQKNHDKLQALRKKDIPNLITALETWGTSFRDSRRRCHKTFGEEIVQIRIGGLIARYKEIIRRMDEYLNGKNTVIPELEIKINSFGAIPIRYAAASSAGTPYMRI